MKWYRLNEKQPEEGQYVIVALQEYKGHSEILGAYYELLDEDSQEITPHFEADDGSWLYNVAQWTESPFK